VANQSNQIILIKGAESETIRIKPNIPIGTVFVTEIDVDDAVIGTPTPPVIGDNFISKREKAAFQVYQSGEINNTVLDEFYYGYLNFRDAVTNLKSIGTYTNAYLYSGRELLIKNSQTTDITIYHLTGTGFQFSFPNEVNFILKPNEIIRFSTKILSPTSGILEYVGVVRDQISDVVGLTEALDAIAPDGLVKEGIISMAGLNASIAAEDFEWRINHIIYKNLTLFTDTLPATTTGYMRTDIFEGDDNGDIFRKQGNEAIGVSIKPAVTVGRIELGSVDVENSTASVPVIPKPKWAVSQQLRDGETGYSPSENVVYDALALKVDKDGAKVLSDNNYTTSEKNKLASIDATHYLPPLQTTVQLSALPQAGISDKARVYVENDLSDYFYDVTASSGDIAPDDQAGGVGFWRKVAVGGETAASIKTKYESNADTNAFTNALKAKLDSITEIFTTALKTGYDGVVTGYTALMATGSRLITSGEITKLGNTSGTNTGDQDLSSYAHISVTPIEIGSATTLSSTHNGQPLIVTASCTVTIPNGLAAGFNCSFITLAGVTLTISLGGSVVLFNNVGLTMAEKLSFTLQARTTTNNYITAGSL